MHAYTPEPNYEEDRLVRANANYRGLWASVLLQAIRDVDSSERCDREPALTYINDSSAETGSFLWVCEMLDLDPDRIRMMSISREGRRQLLGRNVGNTRPRTTNQEPL